MELRLRQHSFQDGGVPRQLASTRKLQRSELAMHHHGVDSRCALAASQASAAVQAEHLQLRIIHNFGVVL